MNCAPTLRVSVVFSFNVTNLMRWNGDCKLIAIVASVGFGPGHGTSKVEELLLALYIWSRWDGNIHHLAGANHAQLSSRLRSQHSF